ncbi:nitroreductase [Immundisolibacter sp.]|uniref:nitroreductase n=1 Tax=Immundisolibacter sp. TaxID=1934948 RepID=UPI003569426C
MEVIAAMRDRISVRAYLDQPVTRETLEQVLEAARWAPSGTNTQPWQVLAVTGAVKQRISTGILSHVAGGGPPSAHYDYYPDKFVEPYKGRRWRCGMQLYGALGVGALGVSIDDKAARQKAMLNNFDFFGAPLGLFFYIDRAMARGSWIDMGMFLQNVMLAARGYGLETCPQFALAMYPQIVAEHIAAPENHDLVCGMSIGYGDPDAPVNRYRTERMAVQEFLTWAE